MYRENLKVLVDEDDEFLELRSVFLRIQRGSSLSMYQQGYGEWGVFLEEYQMRS